MPKGVKKQKAEERKICPGCGRPLPKARLTPEQLADKIAKLKERADKAKEKLARQGARLAKLAAMQADADKKAKAQAKAAEKAAAVSGTSTTS
jgi:hypothetical protein